MKPISNVFISILLAIISSSCDNNKVNEEDLIVGRWKITEAFISAGGPQYWVKVEDGEEIVFFENGTFTSNRFLECEGGTFSFESGKLMLNYNCAGFEDRSENSEGFITYDIEIKLDFFIATPTSGPICIEGCDYKYQRK